MTRAEIVADLSAREIVDAVPPRLRAIVGLLAKPPSRRLGTLLARFDAEIRTEGLPRAARSVLARFGASVAVAGAPPRGPALLVANHPGAYDALALLSALDRDDVAILASDRPFLRALPHLAEHCLFVPEGIRGRARAARLAAAHLAKGGLVVQFGAGAIEPDASFGPPTLGDWPAGTGHLAEAATRANAVVVPVFIRGVHSPRAKRLFFVRWAERRGITTIAPLVQATLPGFRDVAVGVRFGLPIAIEGANDRMRTASVRRAVLALG